MSRSNDPSPPKPRPGVAAGRLVPRPVLDAIRRRRAMRRYLEAVAPEMLDRQARLEDLEEEVTERHDGLYERIVSDVVERTEVILEELDRRIGSVADRTDRALGAMEERVAELARDVARLREAQAGAVDNGRPGSAKPPSAQARKKAGAARARKPSTTAE